MTICTYNARTLASEASVEDLMMQARNIKYDGLTETRRHHPLHAVYDSGEELFLGTCDSRGLAALANMRGASYGFGPDILAKICQQLNIDLVARAHQVVQDGYEFFGGRKLVTIFSAPHYCGQFDNAAAMMTVDENLQASPLLIRDSSTVCREATAKGHTHNSGISGCAAMPVILVH
ncbi:unnamed protein product [Heligmosomoides polygyrus]|uniref:SER_THR_PHOSPHATASE domain-containing protein n=1 Tax=Heligmosomoides polygyrus TaxID=6339 RepID=A0A183G677_HELPZ|nr:unnamed protein product [Heligmosomoides polygyrus]